MSVAARRPRLCEQSAAGAFPLVIGSLRFDLTVVRKLPACRADERPLMWPRVGRVTAAEADARHWEALYEFYRPTSTAPDAHATSAAHDSVT